MSSSSIRHNSQTAADLPDWADCDFFCIQGYAGATGSPCGWRGRIERARHTPVESGLVCPRCGCATLLRIPSDRADKPGV